MMGGRGVFKIPVVFDGGAPLTDGTSGTIVARMAAS